MNRSMTGGLDAPAPAFARSTKLFLVFVHVALHARNGQHTVLRNCRRVSTPCQPPTQSPARAKPGGDDVQRRRAGEGAPRRGGGRLMLPSSMKFKVPALYSTVVSTVQTTVQRSTLTIQRARTAVQLCTALYSSTYRACGQAQGSA